MNQPLENPVGDDEVSKFQNDLQIQSDFTLASATSAKNICFKILMNEKFLYLYLSFLLQLVFLSYCRHSCQAEI